MVLKRGDGWYLGREPVYMPGVLAFVVLSAM